MAPQRVHNRKVLPEKGKVHLRRMCRALKRRSDAKVGSLPDGAYVTIVRCMHCPRDKANRVEYKVFGTPGGMLKGAEELAGQILDRYGLPEDLDDAKEDIVKKYLTAPGNGEDRDSYVRKLLVEAWSIHARGTKFERTKQIYSAVNTRGAKPFPWWDQIARVPFTCTATKDPGVSQRLCDFLGPELARFHEGRSVEIRAPAPPQPHVQCVKNAACVLRDRHRGLCSLAKVPSEAVQPVVVETWITQKKSERKKKKQKQKQNKQEQQQQEKDDMDLDVRRGDRKRCPSEKTKQAVVVVEEGAAYKLNHRAKNARRLKRQRMELNDMQLLPITK